jgi:ribonuclease P protein component
MRRQQRLRSGDDFRRVRARGRSWPHPLLVLFAAPGRTDDVRVGVSAGRRVGGAVVRNRAKRRVREAVRGRLAQLKPGWDLIFVVRPAAASADFQAIDRAVATLLQRAALLQLHDRGEA